MELIAVMGQNEKILQQVDSLKDELIKLVCDTVKIPSVNPTYPGIKYEDVIGNESKVNEYMEPVMKDMGLKTDLFEEEKDRANLVGVYTGTGGGKSLIFNGHVDVVPAGDEATWKKTTPWSGEVKDGKIWGRGTADMKAGNAAALIALKAIFEVGYKPKGDICFQYVVGEEMMNTAAGTGAVIKRGYKADAGIVVEPSCPPYRLGIIPASPSVSYMVCTIKGKAVHASMRDELFRPGGAGSTIGVSSIDKSFIVYEGLRRLEERWGQTKSHPMYTRPGHFTIHPGVVTGGPNGAFVISDKSTIEYAIWAPPQDSEDDVKKEIEAEIALIASTDPWLKENPPTVDWLLYWPAYDVPRDAPICKALEKAYTAAIGGEAPYYGFAAVDDAAFLNLAGIPTVSIGPGNLQVAHAPDEFVDIEEMMDAAKLYAMAIVEWCGL